MAEGSDNTLVHRLTGAHTSDWTRRGKEFIKHPQRRREMIERLANSLKNVLQRKHISAMDDPDRPYSYIEPVSVSSNDLGGAETYFYSEDPYGHVENIAVTIFPQNLQINEYHTDQPIFAVSAVETVSQKDRDRNHLLLTAMAVDTKNPNQPPLRGLAKNGDIIKKFEASDPGIPDCNEWSSGAIVFDENGFDIINFSKIETEVAEKKWVEQALFTLGKDSWTKITQLRAYANFTRPLLLLGYFLNKRGKKEYFAMQTKSISSCVEKSALVLDILAKKKKSVDWRVACLDFGGHLAGGADYSSDPPKYFGPATFGDEDFQVVGYERNRFYDISWPKK